MNILCTTTSFGVSAPDVLVRMEEKGFIPVLNPFKRKLTAAELRSLVIEHQPVGLLAGTEPIPMDVLDAGSPTLKVVSRVGVGWDNVDRAAADRLGIKVFRTQGVLDDAVAELTLGLMLSVLRHVALHDRCLRSGKWEKHTGVLLREKVVGIIGFGSIGKQVGTLCHAFGAHVVYTDPVPKTVEWARPVTRDELIASADIISVHADGNAALIGPEDMVNCKSGVVFINTARGGMIDEAGLAEGIVAGRIGGAGLDVFDREPYTGELAGLDRVVLTPHIGSYAREARETMERMAVDNLFAGLGVDE
ncbi:MAG: NAD(P)-dependent oxidoreductase [Desulfobacter sp.]